MTTKNGGTYLTVTEGVSLKNVKVTKAVIGKKTLKADDFGCTLRNSGESIELWSEVSITVSLTIK